MQLPKRSGTSGILKRTKWKSNEQTTAAATSVPEVMCADSFRTTVDNLVKGKETLAGDFHLTLGNKYLYEGSFLLKRRPYTVPVPEKKTNPWRVSYVAPQSFNDVKRWTAQQQIRGFKTERSIDAEMKRNPSMTTRLKDLLSEFCSQIEGQKRVL